MTLYSELSDRDKESFKFQFKRDVCKCMTRTEIIGAVGLIAMMANSDYKNDSTDDAKKWRETHVILSKLLIKRLDELGGNWKEIIAQLCVDFRCSMTTKECSDLLVDLVGDACAEEVCP